MTIGSDQDFKTLGTMKVPVKRAAYSDRTAWIMAILAELSYIPFDEESNQLILDLAEELAKLTDQQKIAEKLSGLQKTLAGLNPAPANEADRNKALKAALAVGGFKLAGGKVLHNVATDTQGFVACRRDAEGTGMAVICFRGTKQVRDWITNLKIKPVEIRDPRPPHGILGTMHEGFHDAYMSVHDDIAACLEGYEDLPLYITGHSLGGALAVVGTWYQSSDRLAACYTFGAPRVGNEDLIDRFKTPIYRIVNGPDPVPFVPPSGATIGFFKAIFRVLGTLPFFGWAGWVAQWLVRMQKFRHYGYMRYLTVAEPGTDGDYPDLRVEFALSSLRRLGRFFQLHSARKAKRIDKYHAMARYRDKLRAHAVRRNKA